MLPLCRGKGLHNKNSRFLWIAFVFSAFRSLQHIQQHLRYSFRFPFQVCRETPTIWEQFYLYVMLISGWGDAGEFSIWSAKFPPIQLDFHPVLQAEAFVASVDTAPTNISRTARATSCHPAGKITMCRLRLVVKVGVIRMYVFLPSQKSFGWQYQSHGPSFVQASKQSAHVESLENTCWADIASSSIITCVCKVKLTFVCKDVLWPHQRIHPESLENC